MNETYELIKVITSVLNVISQIIIPITIAIMTRSFNKQILFVNTLSLINAVNLENSKKVLNLQTYNYAIYKDSIIEININTYDYASALYLNKKIPKKLFELTIMNEIKDICSDENYKKFLDDENYYYSIKKVGKYKKCLSERLSEDKGQN